MAANRGVIPPIPALRDAGCPIALGTDNNTNDVFEVMRIALLTERIRRDDHIPGLQPQPEDILADATLGGARAVNQDKTIGSLEVGKKADLLVLDTQRIHLVPAVRIVSAWIHGGHPSDIESVMVDGQFVMRDRKILTMDEAGIIAEADRSAGACGPRCRRPARSWCRAAHGSDNWCGATRERCAVDVDSGRHDAAIAKGLTEWPTSKPNVKTIKANVKDVTKSVMTRAKATQKAVSQAAAGASKAVTRARAGASRLAAQAAETLSPPAEKRNKRVKRALVAAGAVAGAAAIAAASIGAARAAARRPNRRRGSGKPNALRRGHGRDRHLRPLVVGGRVLVEN